MIVHILCVRCQLLYKVILICFIIAAGRLKRHATLRWLLRPAWAASGPWSKTMNSGGECGIRTHGPYYYRQHLSRVPI